MILLLCAFSGFLLTTISKLLIPGEWFPAWLKMVVTLAGSFGAAALASSKGWHELVVYGFAGAGLAVALHKVIRLCSVLADHHIRQIMAGR